MKNQKLSQEEYEFYRVSVRKDSKAEKGIAKEWKRKQGIRYKASLLGLFIEQLYEVLADEGHEDIDILSLPTRLAYLLRIEKIFFSEHVCSKGKEEKQSENITENSN